MTIEKVREILKAHIKAAESYGKMEAAFALLDILVAIDKELRLTNKNNA